MRLWVRVENVPSADFFIPNKNPIYQKLVGFHLLLLMGYINSAPYLCMATETVSDLKNEAIFQQDVARAHPLEQATEAGALNSAGAPGDQSVTSWYQIPKEQHLEATSNVDVYLDDLISVIQGGPKERRQLLQHLFHKIDRLFCPNEETETDSK